MSPAPVLDWEGAATALGYADTYAMFYELYVRRRISVERLAKHFAVSHTVCKGAIKRAGVRIRPPGDIRATAPRYEREEQEQEERGTGAGARE